MSPSVTKLIGSRMGYLALLSHTSTDVSYEGSKSRLEVHRVPGVPMKITQVIGVTY